MLYLYISALVRDFINGCRIWPLAWKIRQKSLNVESGLKINGCIHPLPQIDRFSWTRRTCTNWGPVHYLINTFLQLGNSWLFHSNIALLSIRLLLHYAPLLLQSVSSNYDYMCTCTFLNFPCCSYSNMSMILWCTRNTLNWLYNVQDICARHKKVIWYTAVFE